VAQPQPSTQPQQAQSRAELLAQERLERLQQRSQSGQLSRREQKQLRVLEQQQASQQLRRQNAEKLQAEQLRRNQQNAEKEKLQAEQLRRNGAARVTPQAAVQGRFAARFQNQRTDRAGGAEWAREAWRHHRRARFIAWIGPIFWPYAYSDIFNYTFWPHGYDEGYWAYAYDDFFDAVFWPNGGPYSDYAYAGPYGGDFVGALPSARPTARPSARIRTTTPLARTTQLARQLCSDPGSGITAWPFAQIEKAIMPTADQHALLDDLKNAAAKAADRFKASCSTDFPMTPPGRLKAMLSRLQSTREAVEIVRPPLDTFYGSLSDEQKARFNAIGPNIGGAEVRLAREETQGRAAQGEQASCSEAKPGLIDLPIERIEDIVRPTGDQGAALDRLRDATAKAVAALQAACPDATPLIPVGRLEAMERRLDALIAAAKTVQPALEDFYASLSDEQKAHFNILGRQAASGG
jgi:LTXXQ motif family protein